MLLEQLMTGTVIGEMLGIPGNGRRVTFKIFHVFEFTGDRISREQVWIDSGAIVAQGAVPVRAGDDAAALAQRVLTVEHVLYPRAVRWFIEGRLRLENGRAVVAPEEARWIFADQPHTETSEGV